jgi:hypothetical protein
VVRQPDGSPDWVAITLADAESYETQLGRFFEYADTDPSSPWLAAQGFTGEAPAAEDPPEELAVDLNGADAGATEAGVQNAVLPDAAAPSTEGVADAGSPEPTDAGALVAPDGVDAGGSAPPGPIPMVALYDVLNEQLAAGVVSEDIDLPPTLLTQLTATLIRMGEWETLAIVLVSAATDDWSVALGLYVDLGVGVLSEQDFRDTQANWAINLLDTQCPADFDFEQASDLYADVSAQFPRLGAPLAAGIVDCVAWTLEPTEPRIAPNDVSAPPMLVIGADNDPATPHANAVALVDELNNGSHLLTSHTEGHGGGTASICGASAMAQFVSDPDVSALPDECAADPVGPEAVNKLQRLNLAAGARHRLR